MVEPEVALAINREGCNHVAPQFHESTVLPDSYTIQKIAGRSSIIMSQRYVHPTD